MASGFDHETHRPATLGAVYVGQMNKVPKQETNKNLALVWEAVGTCLGLVLILFFVRLFVWSHSCWLVGVSGDRVCNSEASPSETEGLLDLQCAFAPTDLDEGVQIGIYETAPSLSWWMFFLTGPIRPFESQDWRGILTKVDRCFTLCCCCSKAWPSRFWELPDKWTGSSQEK